ncbi:NIPSNAP protein [Pseudonocardia hierapolitana]|uniref:NIPSNAP protein n=1 Tax=Pseudonocardia hierapolitana TaxID=1128676 RepID=A0A561T589_9PSEU|nr:NIPSNAP family protein [Pseudonocardia hierapolitana]TWF82272.1 NIPSNAP protein [Pseudonocardia hierapolitana]
MDIYELRTYTMASREDLDFYKDVIYPRHLTSFKEFDIHPHGFWTSPQDEEPRLYVLVSAPEGSDLAELGERYMNSPGFRSDVEGFDVSKIRRVDTLTLNPTASSPLQ